MNRMKCWTKNIGARTRAAVIATQVDDVDDRTANQFAKIMVPYTEVLDISQTLHGICPVNAPKIVLVQGGRPRLRC